MTDHHITSPCSGLWWIGSGYTINHKKIVKERCNVQSQFPIEASLGTPKWSITHSGKSLCKPGKTLIGSVPILPSCTHELLGNWATGLLVYRSHQWCAKGSMFHRNCPVVIPWMPHTTKNLHNNSWPLNGKFYLRMSPTDDDDYMKPVYATVTNRL